MKHVTICRTFLSASLALLVFADAGADSRVRLIAGNAVSHCQTALPAFDGSIRKRPLMMLNEGPGDAFVTCAFTAQRTELSYVEIFLGNSGTGPVPVSCTGVTGVSRGDNEYSSKTVLVQPGPGDDVLFWTGSDFIESGPGIPGGGVFGVSCRLPQGTSIGDSNVSFDEDVGD